MLPKLRKNRQHMRMKDNLTLIVADEPEYKSNRFFLVESSYQDPANFLCNYEVHQRHCVEIVPTPDLLLKFFESLHLQNRIYFPYCYCGSHQGAHPRTITSINCHIIKESAIGEFRRFARVSDTYTNG